jgi:hypothetical protein
MARRPLVRSLPLAVLGVIYAIAAGAAGVLSSQIAKSSSNERLLALNPNCGYWSFDDIETNYASITSSWRQQHKDTDAAVEYARKCYTIEANPLQCNKYVRTTLPYTVNQNSSCPFKNGICLMGDTAAYSMDTGFLDSREHLGINSPPGTSVHLRKITTCAPLQLDGYATKFKATSDDALWRAGDFVITYHYGKMPAILDFTGQNFTFWYDMAAELGQFGYTVQ